MRCGPPRASATAPRAAWSRPNWSSGNGDRGGRASDARSRSVGAALGAGLWAAVGAALWAGPDRPIRARENGLHVGQFAGRVLFATRWWKVVTVSEPRRARVGAAAIAALASRLTARDQQVALACYEHRVLTTEQLRRLYFSAPRRARRRLTLLYQLRVLDRFRPTLQPGQGSAQHHWILDEAGAHVVAAHLGVERKELRWRHQRDLGMFGSQKLDHQLEVN